MPQVAGAEISLQSMGEIVGRQAVPIEVNSGADIHLYAMWDLMPEQMDVPEEGCNPTGSLCWLEQAHAGGLLSEIMTLWRRGPLWNIS